MFGIYHSAISAFLESHHHNHHHYHHHKISNYVIISKLMHHF